MRKSLVICILLWLCSLSYSAFSQAFMVYDTIPIRHGTSRIRLMRNIDHWFKDEKGQRLVAKNRKEMIFKGKGYFPYSNHVQIPDIYLSSHAAEKTKGSIVFSIEVSIQDSIIVTKFTNFLHEARFSEYGTNSFGRIMDYDKVPSGKCMEVEDWCNAVWADMKAWSVYETKTRAKRMIPSTLIRKRTFKVQEEIKAPPTAKPYDPSEYLKLENYLLKDTEGKYADYNKDPEDIEAEKAAAAAALAEKEKKKHKENVDDFADEYEADSESADHDEVAKPVMKEDSKDKKKKESVKKSEESYDDDYDDEEVKAKSEKTKKEKTAKPKKEKKSKDSDDDDYDDYDD
ncbi:MAG: hypothetical protein MJ197_02315 [Bacteroidales bacterium]|nr:hypothetical protein [Bacteroidales bacterium]